MHSRIFQISKEPITSENRIHESRYEDGFVGRIADYVVESESIGEDIEWLKTCHKGIEVEEKEDGTITMKIVSKEEYFEKSYDEFKSLIEKFKDYTISDFIDSKNWLDFYNFKSSYDEKYGFYVDDNDDYFGTETLDCFMRNAQEGDIYYIGSVFDYHF